MADTYTTSNLVMTLPTVSVRTGPLYATDIATAFSAIDAHDHSSGKGVRIGAAGISVDGNISLNGYSLTSIKASTYTQQASAVATANSVWAKTDGNLWFTNGSGAAVQITSGGTLNTSALITSLYSQLALSGNLTIASTDTYTHYKVAASAARSITLPAASAVGAGRYYIFSDSSGSCSAVNTITLTRAGSDTIDGATTYVLDRPYGAVQIVSDGTSMWQVLPMSTASAVEGSTLAFARTVTSVSVTQQTKTDAGAATSMTLIAQAANSGTGGLIRLWGGASNGGNGVGGAAHVAGGAGNGTGGGGDVTIESGAGGASGSGGNVSIKLGGDSAGASRNVVRLIRGGSGGDYVLFGAGTMSFLSEASTDKPTIFVSDCGALPNSSLPNSAGFLLNSVSGAPWFTLGGGTQFGLTGTTNAAVGGAQTWKLHVQIGATTYYVPLYTA